MQTDALKESQKKAREYGDRAIFHLSKVEDSECTESMRALVEAVLDRKK
jgi:geranylgeranyl pyrophosphate synthase